MISFDIKKRIAIAIQEEKDQIEDLYQKKDLGENSTQE